MCPSFFSSASLTPLLSTFKFKLCVEFLSFFFLAEKLKLKLLISLSVYVQFPSLQLPPSAIPQPWNIVRILCHCTRCFTEELPPSLSPSFPLSPVSFPFLSPPSLTSTPKHHPVFSFSFYLLLSLCPSICSSTPAGGTAFVSHLGLGVSMYVYVYICVYVVLHCTDPPQAHTHTLAAQSHTRHTT